MFRVIAWVLNGLMLDVHNATLQTSDDGVVTNKFWLTGEATVFASIEQQCHLDYCVGQSIITAQHAPTKHRVKAAFLWLKLTMHDAASSVPLQTSRAASCRTLSWRRWPTA
jgi:hypothetical protein